VSDPAQRLSRADVPWLVAVAAVLLVQVLFVAVDVRLPEDRAQVFAASGAFEHALFGPGPLRPAFEALLRPTGWYAGVLSLLIETLPPSRALVRGLCVSWTVGWVWSIGRAARALGGPKAALAAVCLGAAMPLLIGTGRIIWYHVPEACMATGMLALWLRDPELRRWTSVAGLLALGVLTLSLRHTGLFWVASLLPLAWPALKAKRWAPLGVLGAGWLATSAIPLAQVPQYLAQKADARERYVDNVPGLLEQLPEHVGWLALVACLVGAGVFLAKRPRGGVTLAAWVIAPLVLVGVFRAGVDNHNLLASGLAIPAGVALAAWKPAASWVVAAHAALWHVAVWVIPSGSRPQNGLWLPPPNDQIFDLNRPWTGFGQDQVAALLLATCGPGPEQEKPGPGRPPPRVGACELVSHQGMFLPFSEYEGRLAFRVLDRPDVRVISLNDRTVGRTARMPVRALIEIQCPPDNVRKQTWDRLHPGSHLHADALRERLDLQPVWTTDLSEGCVLSWSVPRGELAQPDALPGG
jgi:hypothetical protein